MCPRTFCRSRWRAVWIKNGFELNYISQITAQEFVELQEQEPDRIAGLDVRERVK